MKLYSLIFAAAASIASAQTSTKTPSSSKAPSPTVSSKSPSSSSPTASPVSSCQDSSSGTFETNYVGAEDCAWLKQKDARITKYCGFGDVKVLCPVTCNFCDGECEDTDGFEFTLNTGKVEECSFLGKGSKSDLRRSRYCVKGGEYYNEEVRTNCSEGCGFCESSSPSPPSPDGPSPSPPTASPVQSCNDSSTGTFLTDNIGEEDCAWLAKKSIRSDKYCKYGDVKWLCPDTCDFDCTSSCSDDSSFSFKLGSSNAMESCTWLNKNGKGSIRRPKYCYSDGEYYDEEIREKCVRSCGFC